MNETETVIKTLDLLAQQLKALGVMTAFVVAGSLLFVISTGVSFSTQRACRKFYDWWTVTGKDKVMRRFE